MGNMIIIDGCIAIRSKAIHRLNLKRDESFKDDGKLHERAIWYLLITFIDCDGIITQFNTEYDIFDNATAEFHRIVSKINECEE